MTFKASTYCPACGVKFDYNADAGSDYYHGVAVIAMDSHMREVEMLREYASVIRDRASLADGK